MKATRLIFAKWKNVFDENWEKIDVLRISEIEEMRDELVINKATINICG